MRRIFLTSLFLCGLCTFAACQSASTGVDTQSASAPAAASASANPSDTNATPKKKVKHVYTSDDFKPADPNDVASGGSSGAASDSATSASNAAAPGKTDKDSKSKKAEKKPDAEAIAAQQAKVDELKKQVDGTTHVVADIQRLIDEEPSRAAGMGAGLAKNQSDLADLKKQLDTAQSQLDSMKNPK